MRRFLVIFLLIFLVSSAQAASVKVTIDGTEYGCQVTSTPTPNPTPTPIPTPTPTPAPVPVPQPTPSGFPFPWGTYPQFYLNTGQERIYVLNITQNWTYLDMSIAGLTMDTLGSYTWIFPDGTVYPQRPNQGQKYISGMNQAGSLALLSKKYPWGSTIETDYIPQGNHIIRITGGSDNGFFKVKIDAY